jgi:hypothetical protein
MNPPAPMINKSDNYDQFKFIDWNRELNQSNITKLTNENIKNFKMHLFPIIVDENHRIIDGQHRFTACKNEGWHVYYIVKPSDDCDFEEIRSVNTAGKKHSALDRFYMLYKMGDENAIRVKEIDDSFDGLFTTQTVLKALATGGDSGQLNTNLSKGFILLNDLTIGFQILENLACSDIIGREKEKLVISIKRVVRKFGISPPDLISKLEDYGFVLRKGMSMESVMENIIMIWNKNRKKHRIDISAVH